MSSHATYKRLYNVVNSNTSKIETNLERINVEELKSSGLESSIWKKFQHVQSTTLQTIENTTNHLKKIKEMVTGDENSLERQEVEDVTKRFEHCLSRFNYIQSEAIQVEKQMINRSKQQHSISYHSNTEKTDLHQAQLLQDPLSDADISLLQDRERELLELEENITSVNEIFKDLQLIVAEGGETIDRIEDNIGQAEIQVESGQKNLVEAVQKKHSLRKKKLWCGAIAVVVVVILVIVIVFSFRSK